MTAAGKKRGYNLDIVSILVFNGKDKTRFHEWFRQLQHTSVYRNRNPCKELLHKSAGAVTTVLLKMDPTARTKKIKKTLQEYFGKRATQLHASRELTKAQM